MDNVMNKIDNSICKDNRKYFDFNYFYNIYQFINYLFCLMDLLDNSCYN